MNHISYCFVIFVSLNWCSLCDESLLRQLDLVSYTRCRIDTDCLAYSDNSFCFGNDADKIGNCKCRDGYELISRNKTFFACLGPAGFGEPCEKNMQCQLLLTENGECSNNVCGCKPGAHQYLDGKCYVSVLLGDFCRSDGNCWMTGDTFGNCVFGRCSCKFDREVPNEDKISCVIGRKLGELCNSDAECALNLNAQCRVNCRCSAGFVLSRDQARCLKAATQFLDPCDENDQCSAFLSDSVCVANNCTCANGFHGWRSRCVRSVPLGGSCSGLEECITDPRFADTVNCIEGTCQCLKGVVNEQLGCNEGDISRISLLLLLISVILIFFKV